MVAGVDGEAELFRALADPTRRLILDELVDRRRQTLFEICARLATKHGVGSSRQAISQHLDVLEAPGRVQLVLEPDAHPAARVFKEALVADGIPWTAFQVDDVRAEYERLRALGVEFTQEPADLGPVITAVLDDTCGNLIQLAQLT